MYARWVYFLNDQFMYLKVRNCVSYLLMTSSYLAVKDS